MIWLRLGGVIICLNSERPLRISQDIAAFQVHNPVPADVIVHITWDWLGTAHPRTSPIGEDLVQIYYREGDTHYCEVTGGDRGALSCVRYTADCSELFCAVNTVTCSIPQDDVAHILRMLPMRAIFQHFGVLFLHAAQIEQDGRGILFTAPSGTGKTTQANLWVRHENARLICNDRTLLRKEGGIWRTYGYPVDGSTPVRSGKILPLACVVLLSQAEENRAERLPSGKAIARLMPQLVMDGWSAEARTRGMELLLELLQSIPVYHLACTPDTEAVACLKHQLKKDGVIGS